MSLRSVIRAPRTAHHTSPLTSAPPAAAAAAAVPADPLTPQKQQLEKAHKRIHEALKKFFKKLQNDICPMFDLKTKEEDPKLSGYAPSLERLKERVQELATLQKDLSSRVTGILYAAQFLRDEHAGLEDVVKFYASHWTSADTATKEELALCEEHLFLHEELEAHKTLQLQLQLLHQIVRSPGRTSEALKKFEQMRASLKKQMEESLKRIASRPIGTCTNQAAYAKIRSAFIAAIGSRLSASANMTISAPPPATFSSTAALAAATATPAETHALLPPAALPENPEESSPHSLEGGGASSHVVSSARKTSRTRKRSKRDEDTASHAAADSRALTKRARAEPSKRGSSSWTPKRLERLEQFTKERRENLTCLSSTKIREDFIPLFKAATPKERQAMLEAIGAHRSKLEVEKEETAGVGGGGSVAAGSATLFAGIEECSRAYFAMLGELLPQADSLPAFTPFPPELEGPLERVPSNASTRISRWCSEQILSFHNAALEVARAARDAARRTS